jgi:nucleotide-binding universal stress UspA family protein
MHIIVGVDESTAGRQALEWALHLARRSGSSLEAVRTWIYSPVLLQQLPTAEEMDRRTATALASTLAGLPAHDTRIETTILRGPSHRTLLNHFRQKRPDLAVVGRRGDDEDVDPRVLGSVSRRLVDDAPCPVAVVSRRPSARSGDDAPRIMVAYDTSEHSQRALRWATELARSVDGGIVLAHVIGVVSEAGRVAALSEQASRFLDQAVESVTSRGVPCSTVTGYGDPRRLLDEMAESNDVDLIVVGPRGVGGLTKLVLGSVASYLVEHAERPVAVVPSGWQPPTS